jgi:heat shock protein HslJ
MKRYLLVAALLGVISLAASGCSAVPVRADVDGQAQDSVTDISAIPGGEWSLESYGPASAPVTTPEGVKATLVIQADGSVGGSSACNSFFGTLTLDGEKASFTGLGRTLMACDAERMSLEDAYLAALESAHSMALRDGRLLISYGSADEQLAFAPVAISAYAGPEWSLQTIIAGDAASSVLAGTTITLTYTPGDAELAGSAGCNRYAAQVSGAGGGFRVEGIGATKMACSAEIMTQEMAYLSALPAARSVSVDDGRLTLHGEDGRALLIFVQPS